MSEFLFVTWDGGGNVGPAVEIASELSRRGHRVRFLGQRQQREFFEHTGFDFTEYRNPGSWTAVGKRGALKNAVGFLQLITGRSLGRDLLAEVKAARTDVVVIDCLLFGALDFAARAGLQHAVLVHSLYEAIDTRMAGGAPGLVARVRGLRPRTLWADASLIVAATLQELDRFPGSELPPHLHYTGPALPAVSPPGLKPPAETRILVSLSTTYVPGQSAVVQRILDALADMPAKVVVTTGPAIDPAALRAPAGVDVHSFLPHTQVMPDMSLMIGHGGHSTTMLALAHGLPLLILPMNLVFDQVLIGQAVQRSGAGLTMPSGSAQSEIRSAVERLLADDSYRQQALRLGADIRNCHGSQAAADLLVAMTPD